MPDPLSSRRKRNNLAHRGERQALEAGLPYRVKKRTCFSLQNVSKSLSLMKQREDADRRARPLKAQRTAKKPYHKSAVLFRRVFETFALYVAR